MTRSCLAVLLLLAAACGTDRPPQDGAAPGADTFQSMVDSVLPRLQVLSGLQKRGDISMEMQSRDSLGRYLETRMSEELPASELEGLHQTYVQLGLLPENLDLRKLLLDLLTEQVVGYYDPASKKLFIVEGVERAALRPVLVHELVHALQDQHANLDSLIARERGNDRQSAAQAAIEGHATLVMFAMLAEEQSGAALDPRTLPDIGQTIRPALEQQNSQFPVFQRAPRILRETLLFPYASGAGFVQKLWVRPLETGFGEQYPAPLGERLPQSTEQVLHPESRFLVKRDEPTDLVLAAGTDSVIRENTLGELETSIWLSEHLGADAARFAVGWDGDRYRLVQTASGPALIWYSVWDSEGAAASFASAAQQVGLKTNRSLQVSRLAIGGQPAVRIVVAPSGQNVNLPAASIAQ